MTNSDGNVELQSALDNFRSLLTPGERLAVKATPGLVSTTNVLELVSEIDKRKSRRIVRKMGVRLKPFLESIQQFTVIVDTFIQADPTVAPLVWGSVKFVLLVAVNFADYFEKIVDMYQNLGYICPVMDQLKTLFPESQKLADLVAQFYAIVTAFSSDVLRFLQNNGITQFGKSLWKPFKMHYREIETKLQAQEERINREVTICSESAARRERQEMTLYRIEGREHRIRQRDVWEREKQQKLQQDIEGNKKRAEKRHRNLLEAISNYDHKRTFCSLRSRRHQETSNWLGQQPEFQSWLENSDASGLWAYGKPGSGKSTLATAAVDFLYERRCISIGYFFCNFADSQSLDTATVVASLIKQLLSPLTVTPKEIEDVVKGKFRNSCWLPDTDALFELLRVVIDHFGETYIIIDGIDECDEDALASLRVGLVRLTDSCHQLKLMVSSRHHISLANSFADFRKLSLEVVSGRPDITAFIHDQLKQRLNDKRLVVKEQALVEEIRKALLDGCEGMFLWLKFQLNDICRQTTDDDIRAVLRSLPRGLDATYIRICQRIEDDRNPRIAKKSLQWLCNVRRPLKLAELWEMVALEPYDRSWHESQRRIANDPRIMLHNCGNLAFHSEIDDTVSITHKTVFDFLKSPLCQSQLRIIEQETKIYIAESCLTFLNFADFETTVAKNPTPTAISAPLSDWVPYLTGAGTMSRILQKVSLWLQGSGKQKHQQTIEQRLATQYLPSEVTPLKSLSKKFKILEYVVENWLHHIAAVKVLPADQSYRDLFQRVIDRALPFSHRPWENDDTYRTQFIWAIEQFNTPLLELTFEKARPDLLSKEHTRVGLEETPVYYLSRHGDEASLKVLMRFGFKSSIDTFVTGSFDKPLHAAARGGHLAIINILLAHGASVGTQSSKGTPLHEAAAEGHLAVVDRLLAAGASVNSQAFNQRTPLHEAAANGHLAVVGRLLAAGASVNSQDFDERTPLHEAAANGHLAMVDRLLAAGASVNSQAFYKRTPLHEAAANGHLAMVDRLLAAGASVNTHSQGFAELREGTPLKVAIKCENPEVATRLRKVGAKV